MANANRSPNPAGSILALLALLRALLRVLISELEQARLAVAPLLPSESEQEERCEKDTPTLEMRLDRDAGLLAKRLGGALSLVEAALRGVARGRDEPEHHHEIVLARLAREMAKPESQAGETLRRLRETMKAGEAGGKPEVQAKLKSERIQGLLAPLPEWERSDDGLEIRSRFPFAESDRAGDFLRLAQDLTHERELRAAVMLGEDGTVEVALRGSGEHGLTERDLAGASALDRLYGRKP